MILQLLRYSQNSDCSLGILRDKGSGKFLCYILEDEKRNHKVYGETRIDAGLYDVGVRDVGGFHNRYLKRFGSGFHRGMLQIRNVPGFEYILFHIGNTDDDTAGCLLVGDSANNPIIEDGFIGHSTQAYERIYPVLIHYALKDDLQIEIVDL